MADDIVLKTCSRCKSQKQLSCYSIDKKQADGRQTWCKECQSVNASTINKTPHGRAKTAWFNLIGRCRSKADRLRCYRGVEIKVTKEEFIAWAVPLYEAWEKERPSDTPSIDRIESTGHYELSNMQMITKPENSGKALRNIHLHQGIAQGMKRCGRCKETLPFSSFKAVKPGAVGTFGLRGWCTECYRSYDKARQRKKPTPQP